jgi:CheY-like chemotaxis protein
MLQGKILIADDEKEIRELFIDSLQRHGYTVVSAEDGKEAIERIKEGDVSVAFLDIRMPGMNGIDALKQIRELSPKTQVIMITGYSQDETVEQALELGSFLCLMKPFKVQDVLGLMDVLGANDEPSAGDTSLAA